ncbi:hypothetical protein ABBQ32_003871 [Trebouxia sp. C0010 RCD-2024]
MQSLDFCFYGFIHVMEPSLFSTNFARLDRAQQGVIRALEVAGDTLDELAKGTEAQQSTLEQKSTAFLEEVQAVQNILVAVGPSSARHRPYQGRSYLAQTDATLLQKQIDIARAQLHSGSRQTSDQQRPS